MILSGTPVRADNVQLLANLLEGDELAAKLERALAQRNDIVALSPGDRTRIVAVLANPPWGLLELRGALVKQLVKLNARESSNKRLLQDQQRRQHARA